MWDLDLLQNRGQATVKSGQIQEAARSESEGMRANQVDLRSSSGTEMVTKMGMDATRPISREFPKRVNVPKEVWESLGLDD
jgi:hypothetical protein